MLTFLCGSEEELRRVTTWMCHSHPVISQIDHPVSVIYKAKDDSQGSQVFVHLGASPRSIPNAQEDCRKPPIRPQFTLAFQHNEFADTEWLQTDSGFREVVCRLQIKVPPPSAHERAEALIALSEWLDGKVSEEEKRELLHLPE